jgi:hypothetical protein
MSRLSLLACVSLGIVAIASSIANAASGGVQWSRDKQTIVAQKDVGNERWAITLNPLDLSISGNVFFTDGSPPQFISCDADEVVHDLPDLTIMYTCFGSGSAQSIFDSNDWNFIGDDISLPVSFFLPFPGPCDLSAAGATNGPNAGGATSVWQCNGTGVQPPNPDSFTLQLFDDGNIVASNGGSLAGGSSQITLSSAGCGFSGDSGGGATTFSYAADRDVLNVLGVPADVYRFPMGGRSAFLMSECHRQLLQ